MSDIIKINSVQLIQQYQQELCKFEKDIYLPLFPLSSEREKFEDILCRVGGENLPQTLIYLYREGSEIVGGIIVDLFPNINFIQPIYLAVRKDKQKNGIGKRLMGVVENDATCLGFNWCIIEADNPELTSMQDTSMDPKIRVNMYKKWGYNIIPCNYIQPPLDETKDYDNHLLLLSKDLSCVKLSKHTLSNFLSEFYKGLGGSDEVLQQVINSIKID